MRRFLIVAVLAVAIASLLVGSALAAGPVIKARAQGFGPGAGVMDPENCPMYTEGATPGTMMGGRGMMGRSNAGRGAMMGGGFGMMAGSAGMLADVAALLDVSVEDIQAERQAGKSLVDIAQAKGVGEDTLIDTILSARTAAMSKLLDSGKLTQAQFDAMVEHMKTQIETMVESTAVGSSRGMMRGFRGAQGGSY